MKLYIASDHRGFALKSELVNYLKDLKYEVFDLGASTLDPNDDYPTFAEKVAKEVSANEENFGVLLCGSGVGVDIAANKFDGVRSGIGISVDQVASAKRDDNINILVIASDFTDLETSKRMLKTFIETEYEKSEKHERRLKEIASFEKNN